MDSDEELEEAEWEATKEQEFLRAFGPMNPLNNFGQMRSPIAWSEPAADEKLFTEKGKQGRAIYQAWLESKQDGAELVGSLGLELALDYLEEEFKILSEKAIAGVIKHTPQELKDFHENAQKALLFSRTTYKLKQNVGWRLRQSKIWSRVKSHKKYKLLTAKNYDEAYMELNRMWGTQKSIHKKRWKRGGR